MKLKTTRTIVAGFVASLLSVSPLVQADEATLKQANTYMAMSGYRDQGVVAAGFNIQTSPNTAVKLNPAWDSQSGAGVAARFAMGW